jgi:integrase
VSRSEQIAAARALGVAGYDRVLLDQYLHAEIAGYRLSRDGMTRMRRAAAVTLDDFDGIDGVSLMDRWAAFETGMWPRWVRNEVRRPLGVYWTWGAWVLVTSRLVRPGWTFLSTTHTSQWVARLPEDDPLAQAMTALRAASEQLTFGLPTLRATAVNMVLRLMLRHGLDELAGLTEQQTQPTQRLHGGDVVDALLCQLGVFDRTPQRGSLRRLGMARHDPMELPKVSGVPEPFQEVSGLYLQTYARRVSDAYPTLRHKARSLAHFWQYIGATHPEVTCCAELTPRQTRGFIEHAVAQAQLVRRGRHKVSEQGTTTAHSWASDVRVFFNDICTWATEPDSPFAQYAPAMIPLTRNDLRDSGFSKARRRAEARSTATVLDLQREMPNIRAFALRRWHDTEQALHDDPGQAHAVREERNAFWDWAFLELLLTSGLRIEEACELTSLDILKRQLPDGQLYYLLHVKPSKFGRARVVPIGDQLGRVIAEIIRHVRGFYGTDQVPASDRRDEHEKRPLPRAPYLLQGMRHPSTINTNTIRGRLRRLSVAAGARHADGSPLELRPHDCRRVFASEHLNAHTPVHVIQALLGHATINSVMIYAKLYPNQLVEDYRAAMRGLYTDVYGQDASHTPTEEEWNAFTKGCSLRDMGTHICALPTGEHCPRGLVCLGCGHAQPKKSAAPTFRRMLASHTRALDKARQAGEPAGQIASRELEVERIRSALHRAEELSDNAAAALEAAAV